MSDGGRSRPDRSRSLSSCVDASVAVKWFVPENHSADALRLLDARFRRHIPVLLHTEVGQTIWKKYLSAKEIAAADGSHLRGPMVTALRSMATLLLEPAFDIALATGRTVYDSIYLLPHALGCKFVTADQKLSQRPRNGLFAADVLWLI